MDGFLIQIDIPHTKIKDFGYPESRTIRQRQEGFVFDICYTIQDHLDLKAGKYDWQFPRFFGQLNLLTERYIQDLTTEEFDNLFVQIDRFGCFALLLEIKNKIQDFFTGNLRNIVIEPLQEVFETVGIDLKRPGTIVSVLKLSAEQK